MRYPAGHKAETRAKILRAAAKVFRRDGYHSAGVDKVMEEAGLTAGGFYAHFGSKEALLAETLAPAAAGAGVPLEKDLAGTVGHARLKVFVESYLSRSHLQRTEDGCPLPSLVSEVARTGAPVKASFEAVVREMAAQLQSHAGEGLTEDRALAILALCVGALGVARSVQDEALGERILAACRDLATAGLVADPGVKAPATPTRKRKRK
jgi:TetR/AcrR family transcriptional repressor of nem operon